jgi:hypothetical protein
MRADVGAALHNSHARLEYESEQVVLAFGELPVLVQHRAAILVVYIEQVQAVAALPQPQVRVLSESMLN